MMTGFGSAAKIVCLACGQETIVSPPKSATPPGVAGRKPEFPEILSKSATEALLCSVEQCPLLTESEAGSEIAEEIKLRLRKKAQRRRNILAWTVMLQICVLLGVVLFAVKSLLIPDVSVATNLITNIEIEPDVEPADEVPIPPVYVPPPPLSAAPEVKTAENTIQDSNSFPTIGESEPTDTPFDTVLIEMAHHVFPPPMFDVEVGNTPLDSLIESSELRPASLPLAEPMTLEAAKNLLESAKTTLAMDPENSVRQAARAARIYEELGQAFPDSLYWIMGNALASESWGEPLLESSPAIETMALSADNRFLLAQLRDKTVWLWNLQSPEDERTGYLLDQGTAEYVRFVFSPDLGNGIRWIIGGQKSGLVRIWDMSLRNPGETLITFVERVPDLQDLQISPNGQWLAAFGNAPQSDRSDVTDSSPYPVLLWNLRQMESGVVPMATPVPLIPQPAHLIRFSPNSNRLAVGSKDAVVRVYDLTEREIGEEPFTLRGHQLGVTQIAFAPCGQWIVTGGQDNSVRLWDLTTAKPSPESAMLLGHVGWISALTIDQTGEYILSGSYDRTIRIWNVQRSRITALNAQPITLKTNLGVPESLALTRDGDKMIVLGSGGSLGIYHLPSLLRDNPEDNFRAVTFRNSRLSISQSLLTTDDQLLIFSYEHLSNPLNNGIRLWALQTQPFVR